MSEKMAVVFATDANFLLPFTVAVHSTVLCCEEPINIVVLYLNVGFDKRQKVEKVIQSASKHKVLVEWIELDEKVLASLPLRLKHANSMAYARLMAPIILHGTYSRILYIDCDVIVSIDVSQMREYCLEGMSAGAVRDFIAPCWSSGSAIPYITRYEPSKGCLPFFNSGVLLIDVENWCYRRCSQRCFEFISENSALVSSDQDALKYVLENDWCHLPFNWNFQVGGVTQAAHDAMPSKDINNINIIDIKKSILYFCSSKKPWNSGLRQGRIEAVLWLNALRATNFLSPYSLLIYRCKRSLRMLSGFLKNIKSQV